MLKIFPMLDLEKWFRLLTGSRLRQAARVDRKNAAAVEIFEGTSDLPLKARKFVFSDIPDHSGG